MFKDEPAKLALKVIRGDCLEAMAEMPADSIDAIVTDPPYGLGFMGKAWDDLPPGLDWAKQCLRVLKPGGHLLAAGGSRTWHRLAVAVEDAGFEIRDSIAWLYGSGFPKSLDVSKAIDKAAGAEREVVGKSATCIGPSMNRMYGEAARNWQTANAITAPATPEAAAWSGWGTALKPAFEPIVVARKPLGAGTVAANVLQHGTGALNIDGCRISYASDADMNQARVPQPTFGVKAEGAGSYNFKAGEGRNGAEFDPSKGRWPANVVLDEDQAAALDEQSGTSTSVGGSRGASSRRTSMAGGVLSAQSDVTPGFGDTGGASRFFYVAKAPKRERPVVWRPSCNCETMKPCQSQPRDTTGSESDADKSWNTSTSGSSTTVEESRQGTTSIIETTTSSTTTSTTSSSLPSLSTNGFTLAANSATEFGGSHAESAENSSQSASTTGTSAPKAGHSMDAADPAMLREWSATSVCANCGAPARSDSHATVKPLALMRWLVRLVTPPGGTVLDPFAGSGTTVEAALLEGFSVIGIEREADYHPMIQQRIQRALGL